jgi:hypothetical protein
MPVTARSGFRAAPRVSVLGRSQSVFSRVAIVNRGEAAMRLIHAVRDLSAETGARIETVALYTDAEPAPRSSGRPTWPTRSAPPRPAPTSTPYRRTA